MNARAARRASTKQARASRHSHAHPPSREELQRQVERQQREMETLREQVADRDRQIADAEKQIADLERQLAARQKNSTNSSKPPSSHGLAGNSRQRGRRKKSRRKPGGQKGHPGRHRPLAPPDQVQEVRPVLPVECKHCGQSLPQQPEQIRTVGEAQRHQVTELPPTQPHIIEYQCPKVVCPACGESTRAPLPEDAQGDFGPQLTALIAYLTIYCRMPRRVVEAFLEHVLGISMSLGSTQKCWEQASAAVAQPCQELEQQLKNEPVLNSDETGWRNNGEKRYLWALVARNFVFYTVAKTRSSAVLLHLLGAVFAGILCSDRFSAYFKYHQGLAQLCWAHLKRNILGIQDFAKTTDAQRFCRDALALYARLFRLWRKFQGSLIDRDQLIARSIPLQKRWFALAEHYLDSDDKEVRNMATALFQHCGRLFTFIEHPGVQPTNNCVEQALRIAVQLRKIIFGNRSAPGEVATTRLLTVTQTCRMQGRNALGYLTEAIIRYRRHQPAPSLLSQQQ
ncbi:MAG TPA: IS66 family transposase [Terracidiphilus sp.]|nr:IS66 family transposase [Terracidiphilus sp.]